MENITRKNNIASLFYALRKLLTEEDASRLKVDIQKLLKKAKFDVYQLQVLPQNWEELYDKIVEF